MSLPAVLTGNIKLKLLSLLFAAVLCAFVHLEARDETEIPLQVNYVHIPPGLALQGGSIKQLSVRIAGPRILLIRQQLAGVGLSLDLRGLSPGKASFGSLGSRLSLQPGVTLLRVLPAIVEPVLVTVGNLGN